MVRRRDRQRRLRRRHPQRPAADRARAQRPVRRRGRQARRPADRRHPRRRARSRRRTPARWPDRAGATPASSPRSNGGGFLTDQFPDAYKAIWDFTGQIATSRHVPGVSFTGIVHPGLMGTAPSAELLAKWNTREAALIATDPNRVPPLALPPEPQDAVLGSSDRRRLRPGRRARRPAPRRRGRTAATRTSRTCPRARRVFYPVFVDGANLSMGDLHFSQGDGEITFCGAIEMGGFIDLRVDLIKGGMETYGSARTRSSCRATSTRSSASGSRSPAPR